MSHEDSGETNISSISVVHTQRDSG